MGKGDARRAGGAQQLINAAPRPLGAGKQETNAAQGSWKDEQAPQSAPALWQSQESQPGSMSF